MRIDRSIWLLGIGFAALLLFFVAALAAANAQRQADIWVAHTVDVQRRLQKVLSQVQEAEGGQRGYVITGRSSLLAAYDRARLQIDDELGQLRTLVGDNPEQQDALQKTRRLVDARMQRLALGIELRRAGGFEPARRLIDEGGGERQMTALRAQIAAMQAVEDQLLSDRRARARSQFAVVTTLLGVGAGVVFLLAIVALRDAVRRMAELGRSRDALAEANAALVNEAQVRASAEAQVRQMQKMEAIGHLTGGIAHDFNNMLSIVIGSLDLAKRRLAGDPSRSEQCIDNAMEGAQRAATLTARLLAFSRQQPLAPKVLDPNKLVGGMSELLRRTIGEQLEVETVLGGGTWRICADPSQLENAIVNLCVNSRDAMPDGGKLTIETSNAELDDAYAAAHAEVRAGHYVLVAVTDTGTGMPPEVVERAFDPFYTTKGAGKGTGLGLSQVYGLVKQSGGHVKIYSEPGVGTTVKIYLPRWTGAADTPAVQAPAARAPRGDQTEIVLVVEDDPAVRHVSVDALRHLGYTVVQAGSGEEALQVLQLQPRVDLIFTDVVMPGMTGRVLADRAIELRPEVRVLYTTGYTRNAVVHNGVLDTGVAFLPKPFTVEQLALKVRSVLDGGGPAAPAAAWSETDRIDT